MRVLRIHSSYTGEGGEDHSVRAEVALLKRGGVQVFTFFKSNADLVRAGVGPTLDALWRTAYDRRLYHTVRRFCREFRPDVAHADNLWFALSPSVHAACHDEGVPTVQTVRNYRLLCLNANLERGGAPCEDCVGRGPWTGVMHRCYHGSAFLSVAVARMILANRRRQTWERDVDVLVAPSRFARHKLIQGGLPARRVVVKPNFVEDPGPVVRPGVGGVYVGRLSPEKGVRTLLDAWRAVRDLPLAVAGDGPERAALEAYAAREDLAGVRFLGRLDRAGCLQAMRRAAFLVFPSACYETFGRTIVEAYAVGRPVIASRLGAAAELVHDRQTGLLFRPGDAKDLAARLRWMIADPDGACEMGLAGRWTYEARYTPERNLEMLLAIYARARSRWGGGAPARIRDRAPAFAPAAGATEGS